MAMDLAKIEDRLDKTAAGAVAISSEVGGIHFQTMLEVMEFAKLMSLSQAAVPSHLRGNPGACLAISIQALEWKMSPFAVANKSYLVNNKGEERIAYESQLLHAIIEARAPLQGRLRFEIIGEGDERRCKVYGTFKGETEPHVYISETLGKLRDARGRNDYGKLKGSPLWDTQPEVQLFYSASRQWGRLYCPDTILGIYTPEELDQGPDNARDVNPRPSVGDRLKGNKGRGFNAAHVERETHGAVIEESQAKATEGKAGNAEGTPLVRQTTTGTGLRVGAADAVQPATSEIMDVTAGETAPDSNSSPAIASSPTPAETKPASDPQPPSPLDAGNPIQESSSAEHADDAGTGDGERAAPDTSSPVADLALPLGWQTTYAAALRRAQKVESLPKYATEYWKQYGGWDQHKDGPDAETAKAIFDTFKNNFGRKDVIESELRELI